MSEPLDPHRRHGTFPGRVLAALRNNFLAGVVVIAPIGLTVWLIWTLVGWVDSWVMPFVPSAYHPEALINRWFNTDPANPINIDIRGVGVIVFLIVTVLTGWIAKGLVGRSFIRWGEDLVGRLPFVRSIYNGLKQIAETVFSQSETNFKKACLIQFPTQGCWAIGFVSTDARGEIQRLIPGSDDIATVFMPSTPNPTTGFLMFVPRSEILELSMSIEEAAKLIISAGLVYPAGADAPAPGAVALPVRGARDGAGPTSS